MALTNLEVVSIPVSDQERAKQFYEGQLGFTVQMDSQFGEGMRWVMLRPPGSSTSLTLVTWFETMPPGSLKGSVLACDDLEKTLAELGAPWRLLQRGRYPASSLGPLENVRGS